VPLLPESAGEDEASNSTATAGGGGRTPNFLFKHGPESQPMADAHAKLTCPVAGAIFIKKLAAACAGVKGNVPVDDADRKKRPKAPDVTPLEEGSDAFAATATKAKGSKSKAKGKAKAAGKVKAKAKSSNNPLSVEELDEDYIRVGGGGACRERFWLDDALGCLMKVVNHYGAKIEKYGSTVLTKIFSSLVSVMLEFAFADKVTFKKKPMKDWSKAMMLGDNYV
jgi:hypothetical protein